MTELKAYGYRRAQIQKRACGICRRVRGGDVLDKNSKQKHGELARSLNSAVNGVSP